ncbi:hypothetical protein BD779DRAFT_845200 [Infundibulicybe gibba]|nr:hypothetical protein BD779DRAFT_845200 [Infundibulicybe gibba]
MKSFFQRIHDNHPVGRKSAPKNKAEPEKTAQRTTALPPEPIESTLNRSHKHGHKRSSSRAPRPTADSLPQTSGRPLERRTQSNSNVNDPAVAAARTSPLLVSNSVLQSSAEPVPPKLPQENGSNTYPPRRSRRHNTQPNPALPPSDVRRPTMPLANKYEEHPLDQEPLHMVEPDARGKRKEQVGMWIQDERAEGKHIPPKAGKEPRSHVKEMGQDGAGKPQAGRRRRGSKERDEGRDERDYERNVKETRGHDRERGRSGGQDRYQYGDRHGDLDSLEPQRREKDIGADQISISQRDRIPESRIGDVVPERTAQQGVELKGQREGGGIEGRRRRGGGDGKRSREGMLPGTRNG